MKEINNESIDFSLYDFYRMYNEQRVQLENYIGILENEVVEEVSTLIPTTNEFKFLR